MLEIRCRGGGRMRVQKRGWWCGIEVLEIRCSGGGRMTGPLGESTSTEGKMELEEGGGRKCRWCWDHSSVAI